jgi:hypothetical protein
MANQYIPDQSDEFKKSGMRLITDPASDALLRRGKTIKTSNAHGLTKDDGSVRESRDGNGPEGSTEGPQKS